MATGSFVTAPDDLIIVGGGPAACVAALRARSHGLSVTLVDRPDGASLIPGETLPPALDAFWEHLGIADRIAGGAFPRHHGHWVVQGSDRRFVPHGPAGSDKWTGVHAWRSDLRSILHHACRAAGVNHVAAVGKIAPVLEGGRVCGVDISGRTMVAGFVLDASGGRRWLAHHNGLKLAQEGPRRTVWYGWVRAETPDAVADPVFEWSAEGWCWTAQVRPTVVAWNTMRLAPLAGPHAHKPAKLSSYSDVAPARAADVTWRSVPQCAGPGYYIAGDAAMTIDPASSKGVLRAAMMGACAADAIGGASRGLSEAARAALYCEMVRAWFQIETHELSKLYETVIQPWS